MELTANDIQKYGKYTIPQLRKMAQKYFNSFIRQRDTGLPCISCGSGKADQAGHFYSAGHYPGLALNEDNCHRQCVRCNMHLSGNLIGYTLGLTNKIGEEKVKQLHNQAAQYKRTGYKHDRFTLIESIIKYKTKC